MNGHTVPFCDQAEHVGVLRCPGAGNMASILARETAHTRAVYAVLPAGLARGHNGNPAAALRVEAMYGLPVLLSGLASLILGKPELQALDMHLKVQLERLQRLYPGTPDPVVYFLAGCLPASAQLHLKQLTLLGMVARLGPQSILHQHGCYMLASPSPSPSSHSSSWFTQVRDLCSQYGLPDPLYVLHYPEGKLRWKKLAQQHVTQYWNVQLREHAARLQRSLPHFRASHMSLTRPSTLWSSCHGLPYEVRKATVQARMVSGRYRTCWFRRNFGVGESGFCRVPGCTSDLPGTLEHLATGQCPGMATAVTAATTHWGGFLAGNPHLLPLIQDYAAGESSAFLAFLLDPSTQPPVLALAQQLGSGVTDQLCHMTRTWLYSLHKERLVKLGLWKK